MQKVVNFLEQYVEWIALAIGGAFLLLMVVVYLIGTPVSAKIGDRTVTPANVESVVYDESARKLEQVMADTRVPSANVEKFALKFRDHLALKDQKPVLASGIWLGAGAPSAPPRWPDPSPVANRSSASGLRCDF